MHFQKKLNPLSSTFLSKMLILQLPSEQLLQWVFFFIWSKLCWRGFKLALGKLVQLKNVIFFPIYFVFAKSESLEHSVLEQI